MTVRLGKRASRIWRVAARSTNADKAPGLPCYREAGGFFVSQDATYVGSVGPWINRRRRQAMGERERRLGDTLGQLVGDAVGPAERKAARYIARADVARAARSAGYKSPVRRLMDHLFRRRHEET